MCGARAYAKLGAAVNAARVWVHAAIHEARSLGRSSAALAWPRRAGLFATHGIRHMPTRPRSCESGSQEHDVSPAAGASVSRTASTFAAIASMDRWTPLGVEVVPEVS